MKIAVLGPGGVGGLLAGALSRAGSEVTILAREETAALITQRGLSVRSVTLGHFHVRPRALEASSERFDALIVATKAAGLNGALRRVEQPPGLVLPLLNGLDHLQLLRGRFTPRTVLAGTIRVESDRPEPGVIVHSSPFLLVDMASSDPAGGAGLQALGDELERARVPVRLGYPLTNRSEAEVMWSKLVRLNALACTTSAYDKLLGEIRTDRSLRAELVAAIEEACAVAQAEGTSDVRAERAVDELDRAHATLGSSMQRDINAGRVSELDAIPGAVLRAASRHDLRCPTIEALVAMTEARIVELARTAERAGPRESLQAGAQESQERGGGE